LPLLAIELSAPLLLWTTLVPLFYSVWPGWIMTGVWEGLSPLRWFVYVPVFSLILARFLYDRFVGWKNLSREKTGAVL
jgi:hypothetical protein